MKEDLKENEKSIYATWARDHMAFQFHFEAVRLAHRKHNPWTWSFVVEVPSTEWDDGYHLTLRLGDCETKGDVMVKLHNAREIVRQIWEAL